jgi:hypothetical protein
MSSERRSVEREDRISENSMRLCQEGIEWVHRVHRRNSILSSVRRQSH